jgi:hypothetical protein
VAVAALCAGGCGSRHERVAPPPKLPAPIAQSLAAESDAVAQALAAGDSCSALAAAGQLRQQTIAAINGGRVPAVFQEQLLSAVNDLGSRIACIPAHEKPEKRDGDKGKDRKGHEGEGG